MSSKFPNPIGLLCGGTQIKADTVVGGKSCFGEGQTASENAVTLFRGLVLISISLDAKNIPLVQCFGK